MISVSSSLPLLILLAASTSVLSTIVLKCKDTKLDAPKDEDVRISACEKSPCRLRYRTQVEINLKIKPEKDIKDLITRVNAEIAGVSVPFIGVDGTTACGKIFKEDGKTKAECPLKAGGTYMYKNSFKILDIYPKVKVNVHWGLVNRQTREYASCFEIPARIG